MNRTPRFLATAVAAALAASLAACGGSGGGSTLPSTGGATQTPSKSTQSATAQMVVTIPAASTSAVRRNYISPSTKSMTIGLVNGTTTTPLTEVDLTPTSPNCTTVTGGGTQCTVNVASSAGLQEFQLKMYDQTGGKGNVLSSADVSATLKANESTNVPIVLDGVPASVSLVLGSATLPVGNAGSTSVTVQAKDGAGNIIVGPGGFTTPITLAITGDTYSTLSLSSSSVTSPGQVVTLSYNGGTNVGSTITPSIGKTAGTPATFAGSGAAVTEIVSNLSMPSGYSSWLYPADLAALPQGKVGVLFETYKYTCSYYSCQYKYVYPIGIGSVNGYTNYYVGDTTDPFNPSNATSDLAGVTGMTVVKGMSLNMVEWPNGGEQEHTLATDNNGDMVYGASFTSTAANNNCGGGGGTLSSGVIGVFNPTAGTTSEYVLKGVPQYLQSDSSGNVWFVEQTGSCNGTALLASGYAIGELKAGTTTPVETEFSTAGLASNANPQAMNVTPDGSTMFIYDYGNSQIVKVATATMTSQTASVTQSDVYALAAGPDGTAFWMTGDYGLNDTNYFGYLPGSLGCATQNVQEALFPVAYYYGYDAVYADGSYWGAGYDNYGIGRTSGLSTSSPQNQFYSTYGLYEAEPYSLAAGSGYIWATDDDYYGVLAMQYGQQSTATTTINSVHRIGTFSTTKLPSMQKARLAKRAKLLHI